MCVVVYITQAPSNLLVVEIATSKVVDVDKVQNKIDKVSN